MRKAKLSELVGVEDLRKRMLASDGREQFQRWQAIYLTAKGWDSRAVGEVVGVSPGTVNQWVFRYNHEGPEGVMLRGRGGRRRGLLTLDQEQEILAELQERAERGEVVGAFVLRSVVEERAGKEVSADYLYDLLHRHGWRKVQPRPRNPKADPQRQEQFKRKCRTSWQPPQPPSPRKTTGH